MSSTSERLRRFAATDRGRSAAAALVVVLAAWALQAAGAWTALDDFAFDAFTVASAAREPAPIVVVGIDEPSFSDVGLRWPWPRDLHAQLVDRVCAAGAAVVAFDVVFSEPSDPHADGELARAIRECGRVVLAGDVVLEDTASFRALQRVEPMRELREAGAATGIASIEVGPDQVVRALPRDPSAFWRVVTDRYLALQGRAPTAVARAPAPALLRYAQASSVGYVSYYQALDPSMLPPGALRGKIVVVGLALKTSPEAGRRPADAYATPFLRFSRMYAPGVEVQAQFVAAALAGRTLRPLGAAWTLALALGVLATGTAAMHRWRALPAAAFALGVPALLVGVSFALFALSPLWLPVALPCGIALGLFVVRGASAYLDEARRKAAIRRAFELYVAPAVVAEMTAHPERLVLGGERRVLTIMFTDLAGFTSLSEGIAPETVSRILNEHLTLMTDIVLRHGGTIDKFIGDAVMAFWGAPLGDADHARHAVEAALEMQSRMALWREETAGRAPPLHMRIGLNTGPVVVGNLGSRARFDYTVIGDAVNLASRLESVNRVYGTGILLTEAVAAALAGGVMLRRVDRVRVKGKQEPIEIFTPCGDASLVRASDEALAIYRTGAWVRARAAWQSVLGIAAADTLAGVYLERIARYELAGVPPGWDGTFELDSK